MAILPEQPAIMALPFAINRDKATIPSSPVFGRASLSDGFPIETGLDLSEGGVPPDRLDFNGILHLLSQFAYWVQSGGVPTWNNTLDYVPPARVAGSDGKFYKCVAQSGPTIEDIGPKDPTVEGNTDYWILETPVVDLIQMSVLSSERLNFYLLDQNIYQQDGILQMGQNMKLLQNKEKCLMPFPHSLRQIGISL